MADRVLKELNGESTVNDMLAAAAHIGREPGRYGAVTLTFTADGHVIELELKIVSVDGRPTVKPN